MIRFYKNHWEIVTLFLLSFLISWPLLMPGYFSHHDDLQVMRIFEMRKCFNDLQIPCRWVPDLGWGNGFPLYNYYSAFPYYLGALFSYLVGYIGAAKILFFVPLVLGVYPVYLLAKELFGKRLGFLTAVLYMFSPYRALDLYVRGAVAESFGLSLAPLVLYFVLKLIQTGKYRYSLGLSLSLAAFLLSHNIMTLFFSWVIIFWTLGLLVYFKFKPFWIVVSSFISGSLISAFFLMPAFLEKNLVNTDNLVKADLNFRANFVGVSQLFFDRTWGYGASVPGLGDTISFQIGWPLWWLSLISIIVIPIFFIFQKNVSLESLNLKFVDKKIFLYWVFFTTVFLISIFMTHVHSSLIWEAFPLIQYAQFPWRFLSLTIFAGSVLAVFWIGLTRNKLQRILIIFFVGLTIALNIFYFKPNKFYYELTDQHKLSGPLWEEQRRASLLDYLPKKSLPPQEPPPSIPQIKSGEAIVSNYKNYTNHFDFKLNVSQNALVEVPIFNFPNWVVTVNGKPVTIDDDNYLARISFMAAAGNYQVVGHLIDTPIRKTANILTILGFISLIAIFIYGKSKKTL